MTLPKKMIVTDLSVDEISSVFDEPVETVTRPCLRCRTPIESEGPHHRLEAEINAKVYALFNLTPAEIELLEANV